MGQNFVVSYDKAFTNENILNTAFGAYESAVVYLKKFCDLRTKKQLQVSMATIMK